jgi:hypothetical protein
VSSSSPLRIWIIASVIVAAASTYASDAAERFSDPTQPPAAVRPDTKSKDTGPRDRPLELQAILYAAGRRVAIINGRRVHENEAIESATIVAITQDRVRLVREGKPFELSLTHERFKKTESSATRVPSPVAATEGITE